MKTSTVVGAGIGSALGTMGLYFMLGGSPSPERINVGQLGAPDAHGVQVVGSIDGGPVGYLPQSASGLNYEAGPGIAIVDASILQMAMTITPTIICTDAGNSDAQVQKHCTPQAARYINGGAFRCWRDAGHMLQGNACFASDWPVAVTSISDDCTGGLDGAVTCSQATGSGGVYTVLAPTVTNGNVTTIELGPITTKATSGSIVWNLPIATSGWVDFLIEGRVPGDAGASSGIAGGAKWSCGVTSYNTNTCALFSACAASSAWASNVDAGSAAAVGVAVAAGGAGCTATITVNSGIMNMHWTAVAQYASVM